MRVIKHRRLQPMPSGGEISKTCIFTVYFVIGIIPWIIFWIYVKARLSELLFYNKFFYVPVILGIVILIANLITWLCCSTYEDYRTEVQVIEFVERNASHIIIAISVVFLAIQVLPKEIKLPSAFTYYSVFALTLSVIPLILVWMPSKKVHWLVILRHIKTIPYSYAISFFIAALGAWILTLI